MFSKTVKAQQSEQLYYTARERVVHDLMHRLCQYADTHSQYADTHTSYSWLQSTLALVKISVQSHIPVENLVLGLETPLTSIVDVANNLEVL